MENEGRNRSCDPDVLSGPVLFYNEVVIDHFTNPRNVGELSPDETDGFGLVGDPNCGDQMKLWIVVQDERIAEVAFKSYGCPGAIAARDAQGSIRVSLGNSSQEADIENTVEALQATVERLRTISSINGEASLR